MLWNELIILKPLTFCFPVLAGNDTNRAARILTRVSVKTKRWSQPTLGSVFPGSDYLGALEGKDLTQDHQSHPPSLSAEANSRGETAQMW